MLRQPRSRGRQDYSNLGDENSGSQFDNATHLRSSLPSQPHSVPASSGLEESGKLPSFNTEFGNDYARVTMKTRVAVRDKTPHRFQVVPLRDVSNLETSCASRLHVPSTAHKAASRPISRKPGVISQSRRLPSSSTFRRFVGNTAENLAPGSDSEGRESGFHEPPAESSGANVSAYGSNTSSSSSAFPDPCVLSELNTDLFQQGKFSPQTTSDNRTSCSIHSLSSTESIIKLIQTESPLTHTISRSLQVRTRRERNHPKFSSLSDFQPPDASQISTSLSISRHVRTKSEVNIASRFLDATSTEDGSYNAFVDARDAVDPKSRKRHAIYTPSFYVPIFDQACRLTQNTHSHCHSASTSWDSLSQNSVQSDGVSCSESKAVNPHHKTFEYDINVRDGESQELRYASQDMSDSKPYSPMICLPPAAAATTTHEHHLTHKSSSHNLRLRLPDDVRSSKALKNQSGSVTADRRFLGESLYPPIVLGLFADIDKAIEDWSCVL
ncbi:hypothetical protein BDN70DRAFT_873122 [Pholiota conissans]|uniref:Uncharacterized protein n=1 Tax=Pholiota conissans TaxID=109636 RepID=A0A9P6D4Y6_9AGAR|nr:hypothetical protein BDN70DRAFT_873122 [Pholiota conissans]